MEAPSMYTPDAKALADQERELASYAGEDRILPASEVRRALLSRPRNEVRFYSRIPGLDKLVEGFEGGELVALSGPTKNGKTLLAQTLTVNFAAQGIRSLWISFEVPLPLFLRQIPEACEFYTPNLLIPHKPRWLDERIIEAKLKYNTRAVFIDHLHYLVDLEKAGRNISVDIGAVVRGLKRAAVRHNIVIFLLCHSTKALDERGKPRELGAFDIRDSSFVPQEADTTWIIQRTKDRDTGDVSNQAVLKVCNHRRTGVMEKRVMLAKTGLLFEQVIEGEPSGPSEATTFYRNTFDGGSGDDSLPGY